MQALVQACTPRALQRNGELLVSRTMVGVRRLDARYQQAARSVAQSEGGSMQSAAAPAALTPVRPYHVDATQLVRLHGCCHC